MFAVVVYAAVRYFIFWTVAAAVRRRGCLVEPGDGAEDVPVLAATRLHTDAADLEAQVGRVAAGDRRDDLDLTELADIEPPRGYGRD